MLPPQTLAVALTRQRLNKRPPYRRVATLVLAAALVCGCSVSQPLKIDPVSGEYPTRTKLEPSATSTFNTSVNPAKNHLIVISRPLAGNRPTQADYFVRTVIAQTGITQVYSVAEFANYARDHGMQVTGNELSRADILRLGRSMTPLLLLELDYNHEPNSRVHCGIRIFEASSGNTLLDVGHFKAIISDTTSEALFPVLNELRRWFKAASQQAA